MQEKSKSIFVFAVIFIFLNTVIYLLTEQNKNTKIEKTLQTHIDRLQTHYEILLNHQKIFADTIFQATVRDKTILKILSDAKNTKDEKKKNILRNLLIQNLKDDYQSYRKNGVLQYHFVFPNNKVFLRMHKTKKYGDDLSDIRSDFAFVNKNKTIVRGFAQGRTSHAFRNVYPILDKNNTHIASVEISFSSELLQNELTNISKLHTHFLVNKKIFNSKAWARDDMIMKYVQSPEHKDLMFTLTRKHSVLTCIVQNKKRLEPIKEEISKKIEKNKSFSLYTKDSEGIKVVSFYPIKQNITNKVLAWIVSYEKDIYIEDTINNAYTARLVLFLILTLLFYFIFKVVNQKHLLDSEVKKKTQELLIEKEKAEAATKAKSNFLANMSHEIRTPLNAILGFVDILKEEDKGRKSIKYIDTIHNSSHSLLKIIEDILDFSKIESGKLEIDKHDFCTKTEFDVITHLFDAKCKEKNITLVTNIDSNLPKFLNTDPLRVKQVISNLISNAVKFTPEGKKVFVNISYKKNLLSVSIKDEGIGISKDKLQHIFEAFSQEDSSTTRKFGGTGLGLSISNQLVKLLGGELKVQSTQNNGSTFYFNIPATIGKKQEEHKDIKIEVNFKNLKLLLVEDNKANQVFMKVLLKKMELNFDIANDGVEAIEAYKNSCKDSKSSYDIILMDENMPNMNGIEATKHILAFEKQNNILHTPIVALTANTLKGDRERFLKAGMDEYLSKPLDKNKFTNVFNKLL